VAFSTDSRQDYITPVPEVVDPTLEFDPVVDEDAFANVEVYLEIPLQDLPVDPILKLVS
jgi:hypothetical protein